MIPEFSIINKFFKTKKSNIYKGIGDDAALIHKNKNEYWALSTDTLNINTHFLKNTSPKNLGWKCLAVNISDILAMGGIPKYALLSISMPSLNELWLEEFSKGFFACAKRYEVELIGGDTSKGSLSINVSIIGIAKKKSVFLRSKAKNKDDIWVTGQIGLAALGLAHLQKKLILPITIQKKSIQALERPSPNKNISLKISGLSKCAIDISDGLIFDLNHILNQSKLGANIYIEKLPMPKWIIQKKLYHLGLNGGDDYQLIFTSPKKNRNKLEIINNKNKFQITRIGCINNSKILRILDKKGNIIPIIQKGFKHFA